MKKKIIMVSNSYYPNIGGVEKHVLQISKILKSKGYSITLITSELNNPPTDTMPFSEIVTIKKVDIKFLGLFWIWVQMLYISTKFFHGNIIHVHDVMVWLIPIRTLFFWKKFYLTMHGWEGIYPIPFKYKLIKIFSNLLASKTISVGKFIDKYYGTKSQEYIYGAAIKTTNIRKKKTNKIAFLGRLDSDTGVELFVDVVAKINNLDILFVGNGRLKDMCQNVGTVTGFTKNTEKYLIDANIIVCSGYLSIIEALNNKSIVVSIYNNHLRKDYLRMSPFNEFIHITDNENDLTNIIKNAVNNPNDNINKIEGGYNWSKLQTWEKVTSTYLKLWGEL